jgi:GLPGLI family protein
MKKINYAFITIIVSVFLMICKDLNAQETISGTVKYKQTTKFDFANSPGMGRDSQRWKDFIASVPEEGNFAFSLNFSNTKALYKENDAEQEALDPGVQRAMHVMNMTSPPSPKLRQVYYDLDKNTKVEQVELMTRNFIIESEIVTKAWKIGTERKKILDYICMSAELNIDSMEIKVWFTPQIPISVGPDEYTGLPGLVLAVEKNGETIFLATSVELTEPQKDDLLKPKDGSKVTQEEFDKILKEKIKEFEENPRRGPRGGGHG